MAESSKPSKQRKKFYSKRLHQLKKDFGVHLSKEIRKQVGRRALEVRKNDKVKIARGKLSGKSGKVVSVNRAKGQVFIENITRKKVDGSEKLIPFRPSNLLIIELDKSDARRVKKK